MFLDQLKTGDILLFTYHGPGLFGLFSKAIQFFTRSEYSHVAMVLRDPDFVHSASPLRGLYVWQSSFERGEDPQDHIANKLGVQITPIETLLDQYAAPNGEVHVRRLDCDSELLRTEVLQRVHDVVYRKPYDYEPKDWIEALQRTDDRPQKTDRFWCSALVGYVYTACGLLESSTDWSILRPSDFSCDQDVLHFIAPSHLAGELEVLSAPARDRERVVDQRAIKIELI